MQPYDTDFFRKEHDVVLGSAQRVVPMVMDLLKPRRVVDVGCGTGLWLSVFAEHGVADYAGIDGAYVDPATLKIPRERFFTFDLAKPFRLEPPFDLVVSLEVAEHLPASSAATFVESLTGLGPAVLFSAAIPHQGGVNHLNEQWPQYWGNLFAKQGHSVIDCIRGRIWSDERVAYYYAQNMLLFCRQDFIEAHPALRAEHEIGFAGLSVVHPRKHLEQAESMQCLYAAAADLRSIIPPGARFVLVDEEQIRGVIAAGYRALPFLERDGQFWGRPENDQAAIAELERMRREGARYIAFAWPARWWLDYYTGFHQHLRARYACVLENERFVMFELK